jgi:hypothetical protein
MTGRGVRTRVDTSMSVGFQAAGPSAWAAARGLPAAGARWRRVTRGGRRVTDSVRKCCRAKATHALHESRNRIVFLGHGQVAIEMPGRKKEERGLRWG